MRAFYSDVFVLPLPDTHRFPMRKYSRLRERILEEGILRACDLHVPEAIPWESLRLVHDDEYMRAVATGTLGPDAQRRIGFPWSPQMVERSRRSVGATVAAAHAALEWRTTLPSFDDAQGHLSDSRRSGPPFGGYHTPALRVSANLAGGTHHAFRDRGEGYCVFNDVAVAARTLQRAGLIRRAAVVDCDVHQGNGTAAIFRNDPSVFTLSFHSAKNFPFRKEISDLDVTFEDGTGDDEYLEAIASHLPEALDRQSPDIIFYLAGADPYEGDRLGRLKVTIDGLRERDRIVFDVCRRRSIPVAVAMSGGYALDIEAIVTIHANTIREAVAASSVASCQLSVGSER